jgi:hypothetical protein
MRRNYAQRTRLERFPSAGAGGNRPGGSAHEEDAGYFTDISRDQSENSVADWEREWIDLGGEG